MGAVADHFRAGEGEPLLVLHGFTATWHTWGAVPSRLASAGFEVLAPTLPGHTGGPPLRAGESIGLLTDGLEAMLDEVGWERPHVTGFSLGGWLSLELAKRGRVRSVTAFAPGGAKTERHDRESRRIRRLFARSHAAAAIGIPQVDRMTRSAAFRRVAFRDQMVDGRRVPPGDAAQMMRYFVATPVFRRFLADVGTPPGLQGLDAVDVPVTIAWGERDRVLPQRLHEPFFRRHLPDATFRTLSRAGHVPFWDAPDAVVAAVEEGAKATFVAQERRGSPL